MHQRKKTAVHFLYRLLWLLLFVCVLPSLGFAQSSDAIALLRFLSGIDKDPTASLGSTWKKSSVDADGCPSGWYGVYCSNGRVTGLSLGGLKLSGQIRNGTLSSLSKLSLLYLAKNQLTGSLPDDLGALSSLQQLDVSENLFHGSIPSSLGTLNSLVNLTFAGNGFTGPIPDMFQNITSLLAVDLSMNSLSGAIPPSLGLLPHLVFLNLSCNRLSGALSSSLQGLQELEFVDLHNNQLSGSIDPFWMNLPKIQSIDLSSNVFSGPLPWQQVTPVFSSAIYVNFSHNQLSGPLAPENAASVFANQLQVLDVSSNQLSGELPSFQFAFSMRVLRLQNNSFSGSVPPALLSSDAALLEDLDLSMNNLSGNLASITAPSLITLNLSNNALSGILPAKLGTCASIDLSKNLFSGSLLAMQTWSNSLEIIDLSSNFLTGNLPNQTAQLLRLISFNVAHNSLSGAIPPLFGFFQKLTSLDLSSNELIGEIPVSLFQSPTLTNVRLSHNQLSGSILLDGGHASDFIPSNFISHVTPSFVLSPLLVLDLSWNSINGSIPEGITSLAMLQYLDLSRNRLTGIIPALSQLNQLEYLDLSSNFLTGDIPSQMPASLQEFNVSNNDLSGEIPSELGHRFPVSSFFPGNSALNAPAGFFNASSPSQNGAGILGNFHSRRRTSRAVKSGLIAGCTTGLILVLLIFILVIYKRKSRSTRSTGTSVFHVVDKAFDQQSSGGNERRCDLSCQTDVQVTPISVGATKGDPCTKDADAQSSVVPAVQEENMFKSIEVPKRTVPVGMSPAKKQPAGVMESLSKKEPAIPVDDSATLKVSSPDKLAGDLFLLDNSLCFTAEELSRAPAEVLGRSSHGTSYKATLENGHSVTVKWLKEEVSKSKKDFINEVKKLGGMKHPNILPLKGFYWGPREHEKLIIADFVRSGSLDSHLSEKKTQKFPPLRFLQRLGIATDIACGLTHLHLEHKLPHGNLKSSNILLDGPDLVGRLTDYCLHRLMTVAGAANQIVNAAVLGYLAPELASSSNPKPSPKADVYAFGIILLEMLTGKGAANIISGSFGAIGLKDWVQLLVSEGKMAECFDPLIVGGDKEHELAKALQGVLEIALRCTSAVDLRPSIKPVHEELVALAASAKINTQN